MLSQFITNKDNLKAVLEDTTKDIKANRLLIGYGPEVKAKVKTVRTTIKDVKFIMQAVERLM